MTERTLTHPTARGLIALALFTLTLFAALTGVATADDAKPNKWELAIERFERTDAESPPAKHGTLFVGSSSIRFWRLDDSFPELDAINRGFGGSQIADSIHYFDRIVAKYQPKTIVLYAGDNDIDGGKSPAEVAADFKTFAALVHDSLPKTHLLYIAIKPSIARWKLVEKMRAANELIKAQCEADELLTYVDIDTPMIAADGKPDPKLFIKDGLHLNGKGYELWASVLGPLLGEEDGEAGQR